MEGNCNSGFLELWIRGPKEAAAKTVLELLVRELRFWASLGPIHDLWNTMEAPIACWEVETREKEARLELVLFQVMKVTCNLC